MSGFVFDIDYVRGQFPCLSKTVNGYPAAFLDGPGGSQVPKRVADAVVDYMYNHNANSHGSFATSKESDAMYWHAKEVYADFFNCSPCEVAFGANTSSNCFKLAFGLLRTMEPGDEVIITEIDHEGNRSPWRTLEDFDIVVKCIKVDTETYTLDFEHFRSLLSEKTKVLAINWASNATGTVTDVKKFIAEAHKYGAVTVVDAVHYAPHKIIDVKDIDTDVLLCSPYKFFGPHFGAMYCRKELGEKIKTVRVMADDNIEMPWRLETGTPSMEAACGAAEAVEFIADIGKRHEEFFSQEIKGLSGRRKDIVAGMLAIDRYEEEMALKLRTELAKLPGVTVYTPAEGVDRTSTVSFTIDGVHSNVIGTTLGERGIFVWDGDFYAIEIINNVLGLEKDGGMVRVGFAPYNIMDDVDRVLDTVKEIINQKK